MANRILAAPSPHIHGGESTRRIMADVLLALVPALAVSTYIFGMSVLMITAVAIASCVIFEYLINKIFFNFFRFFYSKFIFY